MAASILTLDDLIARLSEPRRLGTTVALANGCFDVLHVGHVRYLQAAAVEADCLVVAVNDDDSVRRLQGPGRPVNPLDRRLRVLSALAAVD